jgi:hypothetical protein
VKNNEIFVLIFITIHHINAAYPLDPRFRVEDTASEAKFRQKKAGLLLVYSKIAEAKFKQLKTKPA